MTMDGKNQRRMKMANKILFIFFIGLSIINLLQAFPKKPKKPKSETKTIYAVCSFLESEKEAYKLKKNLLNNYNKHASIIEIDENKFYSSRYNLLDTYLEE